MDSTRATGRRSAAPADARATAAGIRVVAGSIVPFNTASADQNARIAAVLSKRYGRDHHINVIVDESILGGFTVQVGDDTIDASIRSRLTELSSKLAG